MTDMFFFLLVAQIVLGGLDNLMHHELTEKLPSRVSARAELALHGAREMIYAVLFATLAWAAPHGAWAWTLLALLAAEIAITLADFIEEDRTRTLPPFERVLHTILALNFGAILALGAPAWGSWAAAPTGFGFESHGLISWFLTASALGVGVWAVRDLAAAASLFHRAAAAPVITPSARGRTLLITGATGFLGEALVRRRLAAGDQVIVVSRDPKRAAALFDGSVLAVSDLRALPSSIGVDAVINLAGAGVANAPWTRARKRKLLASRIEATREVAAFMARLGAPPEVLINASAVGFYGDRGEAILDEAAAPGAGFTSDLCTAWESAAARVGAHARRSVRLRFGLVLGREGGAWPSLALPLLFKLAAQFGTGGQWMAWLHKQDALDLIEFALRETGLSGVVNAVAPQNVRHGEVIAAMARAGGAWLTLRAPAWAVRFGFGEMAHLFLDSQRVTPRTALAAGFVFRFPTIESAAGDLLGARGAATNVEASILGRAS